MIEMPALPHNLPWNRGAWLLLDGVRLPGLAKQLHLWPNAAECLFVSTRWRELLDLSPYLISLTGPNDPVLAYFQTNAWLEPGYLLFSRADTHTLTTWLRSLIVVQHPSGDEVMMRVAEPAVAHQLMTVSEQASSGRWFGPVEQVCLPDAIQGTWQEHRRPTSALTVEPSTLRLTDQELTALGEVEFRQFVVRLTQHLTTYFPDMMAPFSGTERRRRAQQIAQIAYDKGFHSAQQIMLYANVLGYLAGQSIESHPDIDQLLNQPSALPPLQRVLRAAELAESRQVTVQGHPQ